MGQIADRILLRFLAAIDFWRARVVDLPFEEAKWAGRRKRYVANLREDRAGRGARVVSASGLGEPMQPLHTLATAFAGLAVGAIICALIVIRNVGWRSVVGTFLVGAVGFLGACIGTLCRSIATSVPFMEFALRFNQLSTLVMVWAIHEIYRSVTGAPKTRIHSSIGWVLAAFSVYAAVSPGGIMYQRVTAVQTEVLHFGEVVHVPAAERDSVAPVALLIAVLIGIRLVLMSFRRSVETEIWNRALLVTSALVFCASFVYLLICIQLDVRGVGTTLFPMPFAFAVAAVQAVKAQRRWAEEHALAKVKIRDTESKLAAILGQGQTLAGILTPEGTLLMANRRALDIAAVRAEQVIGRPFVTTPWWSGSEVIRTRVKLAIQRAAQGDSDRFQYTFHSPNGSSHEMDITFTPYRDEHGKVAWIIPEGRDITDLVMFEKRAREEQRLEVIGQLAGGIAHDFNNMLTGIMASAQMAREDCADPEVNQNLDLIIDTSTHAAELTRHLLTFARRATTCCQLFDVHSVVINANNLFSRVAGRHVSVVLRLEASEPSVMGDPTVFQSALLNLLVNARDAMQDGGNIVVTTGDERLSADDIVRFAQPLEPGQYVRVAVEDEGCGIPDELLSRIFEPFFTTKASGQGTGLGLAAVLGCVRDHDGGIEVKSVVNRGTAFSLYLPIAATHAALASELNGQTTSVRQSQRALVVDDEPIVLNALVRQLSRLGIESEFAESGEDAVIRLNMMRVPPTIAFVDLHLRGINGCDVAQALRLRHADIPIVIMSGNFGDRDLSQWRADPNVRLLAKPARTEELTDVLLSLNVLTARERN